MLARRPPLLRVERLVREQHEALGVVAVAGRQRLDPLQPLRGRGVGVEREKEPAERRVRTMTPGIDHRPLRSTVSAGFLGESGA